MGRRRKILTQARKNELSKTFGGNIFLCLLYMGCALIVFLPCIIVAFINIGENVLSPILFIAAIVALGFLVYYTYILIKLIKEKNTREQKEHEYIEKLKQSNIEDIDKMNGGDFEKYTAILLKELGYSASATKLSGDFGVDVIAEKDGKEVIIQTKRYSKKVSISAVQEIAAAKEYYNVPDAWLITNNYFTKAAYELAIANDITLIDRDKLMNLIISSQK